jgi:cell division protein FtsB
MKQIKRIILRLFFVTEIVFFAGSYLFGNNGLSAVRRLTQEITQIEKDVLVLTQETKSLDKVIAQWSEKNSFFKEELARNLLQMARKGDQIYFVNSL